MAYPLCLGARSGQVEFTLYDQVYRKETVWASAGFNLNFRLRVKRYWSDQTCNPVKILNDDCNVVISEVGGPSGGCTPVSPSPSALSASSSAPLPHAHGLQRCKGRRRDCKKEEAQCTVVSWIGFWDKTKTNKARIKSNLVNSVPMLVS